MNARLRGSLLVAALLVIGVALALRWQGPLRQKLLGQRLEADLPPDESVKVARALRALAVDEPTDHLAGPAKLRYLIANGFTMQELAPKAFAGKDDPTKDTDVFKDLARREGELLKSLMDLTAAHEDLTIRWLAEASDADVRRRAAQSLGRAGSRKALPALEASFADGDASVRNASFEAGKLVLARSPDAAARAALLLAAARTPALTRKAVEAATIAAEPGSVPILLLWLASPDAPEADRIAATDVIRHIAGPERAATAPTGIDAAAWKAWWEKAPR